MRPPPLGWESATVAEDWSEWALVRDGLSFGAVALPALDATGREVFAPGYGAVRLWLCPDWSSASAGGKGPGLYARILEQVTLNSGKAQVRWSLYTDGRWIYFSGVDVAGKGKDFLKAKVEFTAGEWRMVTVSYGPEGSELWLEDQLAAKGSGVPAPSLLEESGLGLVIGSTLAGDGMFGGLVDEMSLFDYWPSAE